MKKVFFLFSLCLLVGSLYADLTPQEIQKIYATAPFVARDVYNNKRTLTFVENDLINKFFRDIFAKKVERINSAKISFYPKLKGWTSMVFKVIYSVAEQSTQLPLQIKKVFAAAVLIVSAIYNLVFEILFHRQNFRFASVFSVLFFSLSILPIHFIRFRLFIQRE